MYPCDAAKNINLVSLQVCDVHGSQELLEVQILSDLVLGAAEGPEDGVAEGDAVAVRKQVLEKPVEVTDRQEA